MTHSRVRVHASNNTGSTELALPIAVVVATFMLYAIVTGGGQ